jgi:hypothetical protein
MPCLDQYADQNEPHISYKDLNEARLARVTLCALLSVLEKEGTIFSYLKRLDYEEAGFTRKMVMRWWNKHKAADIIRREREAANAKNEALRRKAIEKLTPQERILLGIKE